MNSENNLILIKGEIKTSEILSCKYNADTKKVDVKFNNGRTYSYAFSNVEWLSEPEILNPQMYHISKAGRELYDINAIRVFRGRYESYWHICFGDGSKRVYCQSDLKISESCLNQGRAANVYEYIKQIAKLSDIKNEETGEKLLAKRFEKIIFCR